MATDLDAIVQAGDRLAQYPEGVVRTPCYRSQQLSALTGASVYLKCEHVQTTGSFKLRGALNRLALLKDSGAADEVIAASSGNHGIAVACAAKLTGLSARVFLPAKVATNKLKAIESLGARAIKVPGDALAAESAARRAAMLDDVPYVSPYNDADVIAGQATIGVEIAEQCPQLDSLMVAVGGGGLLSGCGQWLRARLPSVELIGIWPAAAPAMHVCLQHGAIVEVKEAPTLSDGTAGGVEPGAITFDRLRDLKIESILVEESGIADAMRWLFDHEHWVVEGSAALPVAAMMADPGRVAGKTVVVILCGRNVDSEQFLKIVSADRIG